MRILLVDDEPLALEALERLLVQVGDDGWRVATAASARDAIHAMEAMPADVAVAEVNLPGMSGAELLRPLHHRWPGTVRIVLSGQADEATCLASVPHAHQYLAKPCAHESLCDALRRAQAFRRQLSDAQIRTAIGGISRLPPAPRTFSDLSRVLRDPDAGFRQVASVVARDPAVASKVLQLVNSAFFASPVPLSDIARAVSRLGLRTVEAVVLQAEVEALAERDAPCVDLAPVWRIAQKSSENARYLAGSAPWASDAWTAALLSSVGMLALAHCCPDEVKAILSRREIGIGEASRDVFGVSCFHVSAALLALWGLPAPLVDAVRACGDPLHPGRAHAASVAVVYTSVALANGRPPSEDFLREVGLWESVRALPTASWGAA